MSLCETPPGAVVLDFDGTLTRAELDAPPFEDELRIGLEDLVGQPLGPQWAALRAEIAAWPDRRGWRIGPDIVSRADVEPFVLATVTALELIERRGLLPGLPRRYEILRTLHHLAYQRSEQALRHSRGPLLRPEVGPLLVGLCKAHVPVGILTNAPAATVRRKLDALLPELWPELEAGIAIVGDAAKYRPEVGPGDGPRTLDPRWERLPRTIPAPGLPGREVLLRRPRAFEAILAMEQALGVSVEQSLYVGDACELDLLLPAALGASIHLVNPRIRPWEESLVRGHGGHCSADLGGLLRRLAGCGLPLPEAEARRPAIESAPGEKPLHPDLLRVEATWDAFIRKDIDAVVASLGPDASFTLPGPPGILPWAGTWRGEAGIRRMLELLFQAVDYRSYVVERLERTDQGTVVAWQRQEGVVRRTGRVFQDRLLSTIRLRGGRIEEYVEHSDTAALVAAFFG